ncbi:MAG TPA: hypothetical protein VFO35_06135 [Steroidobacteraceae bacterium]|nr:hypothetical protein [Steroidobacteraceae bacterium]
MRRGDFAAAWTVCDEVLRRRLGDRVDCGNWARHLQFVWNGEPLDGKRVLVRCYHGLGDTIQFVRLLAELRPRVAEITLWAQPQLVGLLRSVRGADRVLPLHDGSPDVAYDADIELMELPHALRLTIDRIPQRVPYLSVAGARRKLPCWPPRNVGLVWRSGDWVPQRSIPEPALAQLADVPGVRWHSLQYPPLALPFDAVDLACRDIGTMAARMLMLDLVISVDTMAAHLAGALALPVWTLLHDDCDWRWLADREDTPWYPTMRLFRQCAADDWLPLIARVQDELQGSSLRPMQ